MCTAISYRREKHYFGRNLDVEFSFNEKVVITPRNFKINLSNGGKYETKYGIIGIAAVMENYPLYYEGANEKGLCMAGLNFPNNANYSEFKDGKDNIALFEFIPWILGQAENIDGAISLINKINLTNTMFCGKIPSSPLHFMLSDGERSIVFEPTVKGNMIYDNQYDVMTNNPTFDYHLVNMQNYLNLSPKNRENTFSNKFELSNYGVGMGALGLPGDASSASRFVRCAFNLANSVSNGSETSNVGQFFHILDSVAMVKGATLTDDGKNDITLYSCCINADDGIFYYKTYDNNQINAVKMTEECCNSNELSIFELCKEQNIKYQN